MPIILSFLLGSIGVAIQLWTVFIIFDLHGFLAAMIAFIFPIISQIYLMFVSWKISGVFLTQYNVYVLAYVALCAISLGLCILFSNKKKEENF